MRLALRRVLVVMLLSVFSAGQAPIPQVKVEFAKGTSSKTIKGQIKGNETIDYVVRAARGQSMKVTMTTKNSASYFNVIAPNETDVAIFVGSTSGDTYEGELPSSGDYKIRVYLMRSAARRQETASYTLNISVTGKGQSSSGAPSASGRGAEGDATQRAGEGKFDATGKVPCAQHRGQPMGQCDFGVARGVGGTATVVITQADGRKRTVFFDKGTATAADTSQADGNPAFRSNKDGDLYIITVGEERYEIPEAVVFGG